jgi:chromosome segregation ATPase
MSNNNIKDQLNDVNTVCDYCGISYLVYTEMNEMKQKVEHLEKSLALFQNYSSERTSIMNEINTLRKQKEADATSLSIMTERINNLNAECKENMALYKKSQEKVMILNDEIVSRKICLI